MNKTKARLAPYYRGKFMTSEMIEEDIKLIKKINFLFSKIEKHEKEEHVQEIINIIKILDNTFYLKKIMDVIYEIVDVKYHSTLDVLVNSILKKKKQCESYII